MSCKIFVEGACVIWRLFLCEIRNLLFSLNLFFFLTILYLSKHTGNDDMMYAVASIFLALSLFLMQRRKRTASQLMLDWDGRAAELALSNVPQTLLRAADRQRALAPEVIYL